MAPPPRTLAGAGLCVCFALALLCVARGYECDPGRFNASARAPCAGWAAASHRGNWTHCELFLGCCWQLQRPADPSSLACYAPQRPPQPLPPITNKLLTEIGFFGQPAAEDAGFLPTEQSDFVTFGSANDLAVLAEGANLGLRSFFRTQNYLVNDTHWDKAAHQGKTLFADYRARWRVLVPTLRPWVLNRTISGFFIGDELVWGGLRFADLVAMANMVAETDWGTVAGKPAAPPILYYNEAAGPIARNVNCFNDTANYTHVPAAIDWVSLDFYNPPADFVKKEFYELHLYPLMRRPAQRALVVPDASASAHLKPNATGSRSGWAVPDMVARAREYFAWVATDVSGRMIGVNPWHYRGVRWGGDRDDWELGVRDVPALKTIWSAIGARIKAHAAVATTAARAPVTVAPPPPATVTIDVERAFGEVSFVTIGRAMDEGMEVLRSGCSCTILLAPGEHAIELPATLFNLTGAAAPVGGRLTIAGAGLLATTLNLTTHGSECDVIKSHGGATRITFRDLTFARSPVPQTTQATVVAADAQGVTLEQAADVPPLGAIFIDRIPRLTPEQGLFIRRYKRACATRLRGPTVRATHLFPPTPHRPTRRRTLHAADASAASVTKEIGAPGRCPVRIQPRCWSAHACAPNVRLHSTFP